MGMFHTLRIKYYHIKCKSQRLAGGATLIQCMSQLQSIWVRRLWYEPTMMYEKRHQMYEQERISVDYSTNRC